MRTNVKNKVEGSSMVEHLIVNQRVVGSSPTPPAMANNKPNLKSKRFSPKEKGFIKDIGKGKSGTEAALNNYNTTDKNVAAAIASENLKKPKIAQALKDAFPDEMLELTHKELLKAGKLDQMTFPLQRRASLFDGETDDDNEFFKEAKEIAIQSGKVTASELQRKLKLGYARASRLMDKLRERMIIDSKNILIPGHDVSDEDNFEEEEGEDGEDAVKPVDINQDGASMTDKDIVELLASVGCTVKRIIPMYGLRHVYFWSPDNMARDKALDKAYKIKGSYAAEKLNLAGADGEPLFNDEHRTKSKRALGEYLRRNSGSRT